MSDKINRNAHDLFLVPDVGEPITIAACAIPTALLYPAVHEDGPTNQSLLQALANFARLLEPQMTLIVFCADEAEADVRIWAAAIQTQGLVEVVSIGAAAMPRAHDFWFQDPALVCNSGSGVTFLKPRCDRPGDHARWLSACLDGGIIESEIHLTGGNMLVGPTFRLIGAASLANTIEPGVGPDEAMRRLSAIDPRPVTLVGFQATPDFSSSAAFSYPTYQPAFHIDLIMSLTGLEEDGKPLLLVAEIEADALPQTALGQAAAALNRKLDLTIDALKQDFAIRRNPVPLALDPSGREYRIRAYNNLLVENIARPGRLRPLVWMPSFAEEGPYCAAFDDRNAAIWESLGFEVRRASGWSRASYSQGALRCAVKVVGRRDFQRGEG